jgi:hypothetical protein
VIRPPVFGLERKHEPLAPRSKYHRRVIHASMAAGGLIGVSLTIGILGYHFLAGIESWVDCLYNASMILGGMGPVADLKTNGGKVFASFYALYSGVTLLTSVGVLIAPTLHRWLHIFHIESVEEEEARRTKKPH